MKTNLKPCPFCFSRSIITDDRDKYGIYYIAFCTKCGCSIERPTKKDAVDAWNTRNDEMTLKKVLILIPELAIKILALSILAAGVYWIFA